MTKENPTAENSAAAPQWFQSFAAKVTGIMLLTIAVLVALVWAVAFRPWLYSDDARVSADIVNLANAGASGPIVKVSFKEGDYVTNGQILVELDHRLVQAQFEQAQARAELANASFQRMVALASGLSSVKQQYDNARSEATVAGASMQIAALALEHTYLKSPVNGLVVKKNAVEGNMLEANQSACTIADVEHAWVSANVSEKDVAAVKPGQMVRITVDEGKKHLTGRVTEVIKAAASAFALIPSDNASGNYIKVVQRIPVRVDLDPHPGKILRVGESVEIRIKVR